jgi:hypothetical protein
VPNARVTGHITAAGPGMIVLQVRSAPPGAKTLSVNNGLFPCDKDHGVHASDQR